MTAFAKNEFSFDGLYLIYNGRYEGQPTYGEYYGVDKCHPTRVDMPKEMFVARFKYGKKPYRSWINFLVKNVRVEDYVADYKSGMTPMAIMKQYGFDETRKYR